MDLGPCAYQKVLSSQSYTLRKRPAIMPIEKGTAAVVSGYEEVRGLTGVLEFEMDTPGELQVK